MQSKASSVEEYISQLPQERKEVITRLRRTILENIPDGFEEAISYGMIGYVVPHSLYPAGYHVDSSLPLPFINIASQKNHVALYHMGIYSNETLLNWFTKEYSNQCKYKLDIGKSCLRFKHFDDIPYALIGELCKKISTSDWIQAYEKTRSRK